MKRYMYAFKVEIAGWGTTPDEAWDDAVSQCRLHKIGGGELPHEIIDEEDEDATV